MDSSNGPDSTLPEPQGERHVLEAETELRLEVSHGASAECKIRLVKGSCELWGAEMALNRDYLLLGGTKLALFTWHGCVVDVDCDSLEISYTSDETNANVAYVNTHAQLEALRDEALAASGDGPRVLIVGPPESGKSSLARVLTAYAVKLGRSPLWVDLDPADNALSVPGTLVATPMTAAGVSVESFGCSSIPAETAPLVLWYGSAALENLDLFKAQVSALGRKIDQRLSTDVDAKASGIIVNTNGWIQDDGYQLLLHTAQSLRISIVLIMGHDRLYSMFTNHFKKQSQADPAAVAPKIIKLPRSGGVVSRDSTFRRQSRSLAMKRYFYGETRIVNGNRIPQLTPFLLKVAFADIRLYRLSSVALSASLLPVAAKQSTDPVQLNEVKISEQLKHSLLAVCHPHAVQAYEESGRPSDLYESGIAGFVTVDNILMDSDMLHLLSPCAGSMPSHTLLVGDITWME
mmetsp:Transcript_23444/g.32872  ORF Transcript_23444/g.32872 Transcript_23444/m.32872 type:complete len:462 (+) Transcript_23444:222-1607(+)